MCLGDNPLVQHLQVLVAFHASFPFVSQLGTDHGSKITSGAISQHVRNVPCLLSPGNLCYILFAKISIKNQFETLVGEGRGAEPAD